jgi:hypothetical protein
MGVGGVLLLLAVVLGILGFLRKSKSNSSSQKKSLPEPRNPEEKRNDDLFKIHKFSLDFI